MTLKFHYRTITSIRELPPRWRILGEEQDYRNPTDRYLSQVDDSLHDAKMALPENGTDIAAFVFQNQLMAHEVSSRHLAYLVQERRAMTEKHLRDVQWRLEELIERKPFRPHRPGFYDDASLSEVERQILTLESQKRLLELTLWKDTQELRTELVKERGERENTKRRIAYLAGGNDG